MDLKNKVVLITGSSSGIGQTIATAFAKEGAKIVVNYSVNKKGGEETLQEVKKLTDAILIQADVSNPKDIKRLFEQTVERFGSIDILINNAAVVEKKDFLDASYDEILELINIDLIGPLLCSQQAVKYMEKQGYGKILNTSSIRGWEHGGRSVVYGVSKAGINSLTRTLAKIVSPNIQVNAVAPGFVKTRNYDNMPEEKTKNYIDQTYLKRWVDKKEIADAFIFLAKNDAMTGQVVYVDAGFTLK